MRKIIPLSISLIGFTAMASQIIYMRELLVVFYGNELSISFILASWLICGAAGSAIFGRFADKIRSKISAFSSCQILLGVLLPAGLIATKFIKIFLRVNPGEIIPLFSIISVSFAILAPVCMLLGFMFSLGCRIYESQKFAAAGAVNIGMVYMLEALGSIIGGALTSFVFIKLFTGIQITAIFALLNILAAILLILFSDNDSRRAGLNPPYGYGFLSITAALVIAIATTWAAGGFRHLERYALKKQWQGYKILDSKNSIYGNILIAKRGEDYSFFYNGIHLYTVPDKPTSEEAVHLALLEHPDPKEVLLIGGGIGGLAEEILKHPVKRVDYVELDPLIIKIAENHLPKIYYEALKDPRVSIKNMDGRFFVKRNKDKYDCVIIHAGDPYTAEGNRYYTAEFFNEVKKILKKGGIISFALSSSESYISKSLSEFLRSIYATLKSVFNEVLVIPGETAYFLASDSTGLLTYDYKILEERTRERVLHTQYVRDYYLFSKLSPEKITYIENIVKVDGYAPINYDSRPASYYYGLIFWTTLFRDSAFSRILKAVTESVIWKGIGILILLLTAASTYKKSFKRTTLMAVMAGGFSSMAFQILILLTFQAMYGYLFYKLGLILTAFMGGLALGAFFVIKVIHNSRGRLNVPYYHRALLIAVQGDFIIFSVLLGVIFSQFCSEGLFPILSVIAGSIGGSQFALASKVLFGERDRVGKIGGLSYGVDLLGSFFGALLTGIFLIPILGIPKTCFAVALVNIAVLALLVVNVRVEE